MTAAEKKTDEAFVDALVETFDASVIDEHPVRDGQAALFAALSAAQGKFPPIPRDKKVFVKTRDGRSYSFTYAPLDTIFAAVRPALAANGLAVTQTFRGDDLITSLLHSAGGTIESVMTVQRGTGSWQEYGSAQTYARRYALVALLGIASEEDDDGNAASGNEMEENDADPDPDVPWPGAWPMGKHKGQPMSDTPGSYLHWYIDKGKNRLWREACANELELRKVIN